MNDAKNPPDKSLALNENNTTTQPDSKTKVHFSEEQVPDYVSGEREPITIRIDTGVYKRFKPNAKRIYGSTCKAVEGFMIAVNELVEKNVYFSNTAKPINIEKIVIERNLSRDRRGLREEASDSGVDGVVVNEVRKPENCACGEPSVVYLPMDKKWVCRTHFAKARKSHPERSWQPKEEWIRFHEGKR